MVKKINLGDVVSELKVAPGDYTGLELDDRAVDLAWKLTMPEVTREQFLHCVNANPKLNGFTYKEHASHRLATQALDMLYSLLDVASGERQVAVDDTEGMAWVHNTTSIFLGLLKALSKCGEV